MAQDLSSGRRRLYDHQQPNGVHERLSALAIGFLLFFGLFLFYSVNYRTLVILITPDAIDLTFGLFAWRVPLDAVAQWREDETSMWRVGGAGIHFMMIRGRYRVFLNFLEHPRVVLELSKAKGPVRDVSFSTRRSAELLDVVAASRRPGMVPPRPVS